MEKGFGIAALVVAIIAIFVPIYGVFVSAVAVVLAVIAALAGDRAFSVATPLIAGVNTFFLSPTVWIAIESAQQNGGRSAIVMVVIAFLVAPFVAMVFGKKL